MSVLAGQQKNVYLQFTISKGEAGNLKATAKQQDHCFCLHCDESLTSAPELSQTRSLTQPLTQTHNGFLSPLLHLTPTDYYTGTRVHIHCHHTGSRQTGPRTVHVTQENVRQRVNRISSLVQL